MLNQWLDWASIRHFLLNTAGFVEKKRVAVTGWTDGSLTNSNRPNYIRVRFMDDDTEVEAWNENVPHVLGLQIYVYSDKDEPSIWRARYPSKNYTSDFKFVFSKPHAINHDFYAMDPTMISVRQFLPFHPSLAGSWSVRVRSGWITFDNKVYWFGGETVDLSTHKPETGARFVLLTAALVDVAGVMTVKMIVTDGEPKAAALLKAPDDFPLIPEGQHYPILAAKLNSARATMKDVQVGGDILDLRLAGTSGGGGGTGPIIELPPSRLIVTGETGQPVTDSPLWDPEGRIVWLEDPTFVPPGTDLVGIQVFTESVTPGAQYVRASDANYAGSVNFVKYGGTLANRTAVLSGWRLGSVSFGGHYGTGIDALKARFSVVATQDWSDPNRGCGYIFSVTPNNSNVMEDVIWIYGDQTTVAKPMVSLVEEPLTIDDGRFVTAAWVRDRIELDARDLVFVGGDYDVMNVTGSGYSDFVGTIASIAGNRLSFTYNITSGNENAMVPTSVNHLAKLRIHNITRGTYALISNCNIGTNTITPYAEIDSTWQVGDQITIRSQLVNGTYGGGSGWFVDFEFVSGIPLTARGIKVNCRLSDTGGAGLEAAFHPVSPLVLAKQTLQITTQSTSGMRAQGDTPITDRAFSCIWLASGAASLNFFVRLVGYYK